MTPRFETGDERYAWLNRIQAVGKGHLEGSEAMRPYSTGGNYVNAQTPDEDESRLTAAYGDNLERLAKVKAAYDPENLFRLNRNIAPAA